MEASTKETLSALQAAYNAYCEALVSACAKRGIDSTGFIPYMTLENGAHITVSLACI